MKIKKIIATALICIVAIVSSGCGELPRDQVIVTHDNGTGEYTVHVADYENDNIFEITFNKERDLWRSRYIDKDDFIKLKESNPYLMSATVEPHVYKKTKDAQHYIESVIYYIYAIDAADMQAKAVVNYNNNRKGEIFVKQVQWGVNDGFFRKHLD